MQVIDPTIKIKFKENSDDSNNGDITINKKTPAVTIVAAWINAEIGVGPSIESGNQNCKGTCADFAIAPINKSIQIALNALNVNPNILTLSMLIEFLIWNIWL